MAVLDPLKVIITNYSENQIEELQAENNPEDESAGYRNVVFSKEIYIEHSDFMIDPPKKYFRLSPGKEVRLRYGYIIKCTKVIRDEVSNKILQIEEKPLKPDSHYCVTGLYVYDNRVFDIIKTLNREIITSCK